MRRFALPVSKAMDYSIRKRGGTHDESFVFDDESWVNFEDRKPVSITIEYYRIDDKWVKIKLEKV